MAQRPTFQPRFTLAVVYFFAFFFVYSLLLAAPQLFEILQSVPPGPEQEEAAREATREVLRGRLPLVFLATAVTVGLLIWARVLPGLRGPAV